MYKVSHLFLEGITWGEYWHKKVIKVRNDGNKIKRSSKGWILKNVDNEPKQCPYACNLWKIPDRRRQLISFEHKIFIKSRLYFKKLEIILQNRWQLKQIHRQCINNNNRNQWKWRWIGLNRPYKQLYKENVGI